MDKAEIERRARKQVSYEEKAFRIVERLLDNPITEEFLTDVLCLANLVKRFRQYGPASNIHCLTLVKIAVVKLRPTQKNETEKTQAHYITPSHYADVVEERGIANQCGYPLCPNQLGSVPKKKFHISTKTNKVYDISQRKNFCSNRCYEASVLFAKQISSSPVWSRDDEPRVMFKLLPLDGRGGLVGDVIISPAMEVKEEYEQLKKLEKYEEVLSQKKEKLTQIQRSDEKEAHIRHNADSQVEKPKDQSHVEAFTKHADETELIVESELSESVKKMHLNMETPEKIENCVDDKKFEGEIVKKSENNSLAGNSSLNLMTERCSGNADTSQESKGMTSLTRKSKVCKPKANLSNSAQPCGMSKTEYLMKLLDKKKLLLSKMVQHESLDVKPKTQSAQTDTASYLATVFLKPDSHLISNLNHSESGDSELDSHTGILVRKDGGKAASIQLSKTDQQDKKSENYSEAHHGDKSKYYLSYCYGNKTELNSDGDQFKEEDSQEKSSIDELIYKNTGTKPPHSLEVLTDISSARVIAIKPVPQLHSPQSSPANPVRASPLALICQNMFEWLTKESIDYLGLMGEGSKNKLPKGFHKQYETLTKRLDVEERYFEDFLGEETMEKRNDTAAKPLPDIRQLKEETRAFELKVTEFYGGASSSSSKKTKQGEVAEHQGIVVLPTVDNHDQMVIRRKIVMDRLSKVIPEFLQPLKITLQDVFTELKELIGTFSLTSKNILYKHVEWMLVCLILLKMLSKKIKVLEDSFQSASSEKYFTILLKGIGETPASLDHYLADMLHQRMQSY